jgi:glycosyltransferase involved in cell wall biosynthesis
MAKDWLNPEYQQNLVSVIIPCHNQKRYLPECLESVTGQDYRPIEIIIVNDGSTERTWQIMQEFENMQFDKVQVKCIHQTRQGAQIARNIGCISDGKTAIPARHPANSFFIICGEI